MTKATHHYRDSQEILVLVINRSMDRKYVYTSYDYYHSQEYKEKYSEKERKSFEGYRKKTEPIEYFVDYIRYSNIFTLTFNKESEYGSTLTILMDIAKYIFYATDIKEDKDTYLIHISLSDLVRLSLINDLRIHHTFSKEALKRIATLLRYDDFQSLKPDNAIEKEKYIAMYALHPYSFEVLSKKEYSAVERKGLIDKIEKKIKSDNIHIVHQFHQSDVFEKVLYYMFNTQKRVYIFISIDKDYPYWIWNINYIHSLDKVLNHSWLYIDLFRIAWFIQMKNNNNKSMLSTIQKELIKYQKEWITILEAKHKYIKKLRDKKMRAGKNKQRKEYEKISKEVQRQELEKDIGILSLPTQSKVNIRKKTVSKNSIDIKFFEQAIPHINRISHWEVTISIDKKKLKEFSVYSKYDASKIDDIKKENPYAEIWGVQYEWKRQYTTLRYKKKVA